mmetsp:Transcript_7628/g.12106  ORF Transcript_7628/g.12106 Transcript_7628/m.12106 type:complete len:263 (+) Transcript_7628:798-1586(+)
MFDGHCILESLVSLHSLSQHCFTPPVQGQTYCRATLQDGHEFRKGVMTVCDRVCMVRSLIRPVIVSRAPKVHLLQLICRRNVMFPPILEFIVVHHDLRNCIQSIDRLHKIIALFKSQEVVPFHKPFPPWNGYTEHQIIPHRHLAYVGLVACRGGQKSSKKPRIQIILAIWVLIDVDCNLPFAFESTLCEAISVGWDLLVLTKGIHSMVLAPVDIGHITGVNQLLEHIVSDFQPFFPVLSRMIAVVHVDVVYSSIHKVLYPLK